jgi:hypothetical protein
MQDLITAKDLEILSFVIEGGGVDVPMAASSVNQNKNFYMRVRKLENLCLFTRKKFEGEPSLFTISSKGKLLYREIINTYKEVSQTC